MASDDKQLSGMEGTCDRVHPDHGHRPHQLRPDCGNWYPIGKPRPASPTPEQPAQDREAGIAYMVQRFLGWRLPEDFRPDGGISFKATFNEHTAYPGRHEPSGTNLLDATQAEAMVRYLIDGMPALAPPAQTQQVLSDEEKIGREVADLLGRAYVPDPREGEPGDAETYEGAPFNPDKQPSPSAAPAQEPELLKALRAALGTMQGPMAEMERRCVLDRPHDHGHLRALRAAMKLLQDAHDTALAAQPASPEGALREALRYARDHITGSAPLWRTQSEVIDIIDSALHDPIGTYRCPVCDKDTPHHHHASIGQAAVAREDDQKALRAAALEEAARQLVEGDAALELRHDGGAPPVYFEVCVLCDEGNDRVGQNIKHNPQKACGKLAAALAGSPAGEGREDNQEQQSGKGASDGDI